MGLLFKEKLINIQIVVYDMLTYSMKNQQLANNILIFHYKEKMNKLHAIISLFELLAYKHVTALITRSFMFTIFS